MKMTIIQCTVWGGTSEDNVKWRHKLHSNQIWGHMPKEFGI